MLFTADAPPKEWDLQHREGMRYTVMNTALRSGHSIRSNMPVPRLASCHFFRRLQTTTDFYFA